MKVVILAGGGGTRLWPLSTPKLPKQFQKLVSDKTMLEETIDRLDFLKPSDIYIAINKDHQKLVQKICPRIPVENLIVEPALRDTASCIGYAAAILQKENPDEVMVVIYADHLIKNKKEFQKKLKLAATSAKKLNTLNIVEVEATEPNTKYGYVRLGKELTKDVFELGEFVEKPSLEKAKKYVKSGRYLWNTGIYVWKVSTLLNEYADLQGETYEKLIEMIQDPSTVQKIYPTLPKISIDYAIMEKVDSEKVHIIKARDLGWSDIGSWEAIWQELATSPTANVTRGPVELTDCKGCLVYADNKRPIKVKNLRNTVIVDTPDGKINKPIF
jgi:mannose-1-phosphate guanylyltransferase